MSNMEETPFSEIRIFLYGAASAAPLLQLGNLANLSDQLMDRLDKTFSSAGAPYIIDPERETTNFV